MPTHKDRTATMNVDYSKLLHDAADYMKEHGFTKHTARDDEGRVCIHGAISQVARQTLGLADIATMQVCGNATLPVISVLRDKGWHIDIARWNDRGDTTQDDAMWLLHEAADKARFMQDLL